MAEPRELGDWEFVQEFIRFFGAGRALALMGWCIWWAINGARTFSDLQGFIQEQREQGGWSRTRTYAAVADMKRFRYHLAKLEGRELPVEDVAKRVLAASDKLRAANEPASEAGKPGPQPEEGMA